MTADEFIDYYYDYYLHLEKRLLATRDCVAFSVDNYSVYSNEYTSLLIAICSELDGLFKEICGYPGDQHKDMGDYKGDIILKYPNINNQIVKVSYFKNEIRPFETLSTSMDWWKSYNLIKHNRIINIKNANLKAVIYSLSALFILNRYKLNDLKKNHYCLLERSSLFRLKGWSDELRTAMFIENNHAGIMAED